MEFKLEKTFQNARNASRALIEISTEEINSILVEIADKAIANTDAILEANQKDLDRMDKNDPKYDRLLLNAERIAGIAGDIKNVANLESPIGKLIENKVLDNGLDISRIKVPIGVIGVIYEARPNVSFDVFAICFKTQNACILKGGSDAEFSNIAIVNIIKEVLKSHNINTDVVTLLPADRSATTEMLNAVKYVDVIIPRGSQGLINYVRENAKVPVIETGAGIVHIYFDKDGDVAKGAAIIANAKTRRVSVCNALDCLLIHESQLSNLNKLSTELAEKGTTIYADEKSFAQLTNYPKDLLNKADKDHFGTEFLANTMSIKTVENIDEALNHIAEYSSKHSEAIISENAETITKYLNVVDAAAVYANASTAYTDGAQFGLGAEIGISTQKLHARGPMALDEITSYKWVIKGNGQTRS
ncbi:gamma-glutamyl-phosphate reductase [Wenyingzhuangia fucanilytica]|uniref:Gamma-glutamyl phosphate reductase n=1 Tax=Wenyingzhuangia fucanilytica TaxID=1790137 RepID=A0A1B1Y716_9FLAO|nr:glutamate-5-semialdehyde dehydrogenase [Wenyingzhuangia fucanilytica]ANW96560.1 gamma-glutamyl-phosphate reductase [Wenyingzhuangia fucanilytica]